VIVVTNVKIVNKPITNLNGVFCGETRVTGGQVTGTLYNIIKIMASRNICACDGNL
jgi:hypothetical protein